MTSPPVPPPTPPAPSPPPVSASVVGPAVAPQRSRWRWPRRAILLIALGAAVAVAIPPAAEWVRYRRGHSLTDDAFVETHIVNLAPEAVSGRIVRLTKDENDRV